MEFILQANSRLNADLLEMAEDEGRCDSMDNTIKSLSEAIAGLNPIKQQWACEYMFLSSF